MSEAVWYPLCRPDDQRIKIKRAEGIYLYDTRGKEYIDANSGLWNMPLGYSNKHIHTALVAQLEKIHYVNACEFGTEEVELLSEKLRSIHHEGIEKIVYTCTGSEAVELAIKFIRKYASMEYGKAKRKIAILKNSYHGSYYGSMSCSDYDGTEREGYGPILDGIVELTLPFCTCCRSKNVSESCKARMQQQLTYELERYNGEIAGIILEPVLGSAGVIPLPEWFLRIIDEYAKKNDALTVYDEVATGFGRSGSMFCYQKYNMCPDIVTMSKAMNNGELPIGAVAVSSKVVEAFRKKKELLFHLSTQNGNALCCVTALETINELLDNKGSVLNNALETGDYFEEKVNEMMPVFPRIFDLRRSGMMFAIDFLDKDLNHRMRMDELIKMINLLKKNGVITEWSYIDGLTSCMVLFLPYIMSKSQVDVLVERLHVTFNRML